MPPPIVFFSYCPDDEALRDELRNHLSVSMRQGVLCTWHDRRIEPGQDRRKALFEQLDAARVILLLISADYLASDACYEEMERALSRDRSQQARVIPVILRDCDWRPAPFAYLEVLPRGAKPVVRWASRDEAWEQVARAIRETIVAKGAGPPLAQARPAELRQTNAPQLPTAAVTAPHRALDPITRRNPIAARSRDPRSAWSERMRTRAMLLGAAATLSLAVFLLVWAALRDREDETIPPILFAGAPAVSPSPGVAGAVASATTAPPKAPRTAPAPPNMVPLRAGTFMMGADGQGLTEGPPHRVTISRDFFIDRTEMTFSEYQACVVARVCGPSGIHGDAVTAVDKAKHGAQCNATDPSRSRHPINCIDQDQAAKVCSFYGKRLPTEAEWEYAARGVDSRLYPWGNTASCDRGAFTIADGQNCRSRGTRDVGSFPSGVAPSGALDMAGNVFEWVADGWDPDIYKRGDLQDPMAPIAGRMGVLRGGGWDWNAESAKATFRLAHDRLAGHVSTGVRCAKTAE